MTWPSADLWLSEWQRKQPGESMWPMLFGYVPQVTFIAGKTFCVQSCCVASTARVTSDASTVPRDV